MSKHRNRGGNHGGQTHGGNVSPATSNRSGAPQRGNASSPSPWQAARVGRAPYNFVPPPSSMKYVDKPRDLHDRYGMPAAGDELLSGYIDLTLKAATPFYVRGMWNLASFEDDSKEIKNQIRPFEIEENQLRLPGSSIRGMIRTLVEILSSAPLDPINEDLRMFYRAVGSDPRPDRPSYDPTAGAYKRMIWTGNGTATSPALPIVKAGILDSSGKQWKIWPSAVGPFKTQWYRVERNQLHGAPIALGSPKKIWFVPEKPQPWPYHRNPNLYGAYGLVTTWRDRAANGAASGMEPGYLIQSGHIERKYMQWIIHDRDAAITAPVPIPQEDREAFEGDDDSSRPKEIRQYFAHPGTPCFYQEWVDSKGNPRVSFGHTPYFRIPYENTPGAVNPAKREGSRWDVAQAIFGRLVGNQKDGAASRIFVEDGILVKDSPAVVLEEVSALLGSPRPTTYQHYLQQESSELPRIKHWDHRDARLRGFKRNWHRSGARLPAIPTDNEDLGTKFCPAQAGAVFTSRIRYENLSAVELGALLTAIDLPEGCYHQIGMAKGYGYGSLQVSVELREINRSHRYAGFFSDIGELIDGASSAVVLRCQSLKDTFAAFVGAGAGTQLWKTDRLKELAALLQFEAPRTGRVRWLNATRNLRLGKLQPPIEVEDPRGRRTDNVNEFVHTYDSQRPRRGTLARRRALPPATVVRRMDPNEISTDPSPFGNDT